MNPRPSGRGKARAVLPVTRPATPSLLVATPAQPEAPRVAVTALSQGDARGALRGGRGGAGAAVVRPGNTFPGRGQGNSVRSPSPRVVSASDQEYDAGIHKIATLVNDRNGTAEGSEAFGHEVYPSDFLNSLLHVPMTLKSRGNYMTLYSALTYMMICTYLSMNILSLL